MSGPKCGMALIGIDYKNIKIDKHFELKIYGLTRENQKLYQNLRKQFLINNSAPLRSDQAAEKPETSLAAF